MPTNKSHSEHTLAIDMSPEAIAARLRRCAEISELCRKLKAAPIRRLKSPEAQLLDDSHGSDFAK